jgi:hypothetical protein
MKTEKQITTKCEYCGEGLSSSAEYHPYSYCVIHKVLTMQKLDEDELKTWNAFLAFKMKDKGELY